MLNQICFSNPLLTVIFDGFNARLSAWWTDE